MKRLASTVVLLAAIASHTYAQDLQVGMRAGTSMWLKDYPQNQQFTMDKVAYVRLEKANRVALEASIDYYSFNYSHTLSAFNETSGVPYTIHDHALHNYYELNLCGQYLVSRSHKGKLKTYLGANITPTYISGMTTDHDYVYTNSYYQAPDVVELNKRISTLKLICGFNYSISYRINKHWAANGLLQYEVVASKFFNPDVYGIKWEHLPSSNFGVQAGLGYYLK